MPGTLKWGPLPPGIWSRVRSFTGSFQSATGTGRDNVPMTRWPLNRSTVLFFGVWLFVIGASVHDGFLVLANRQVMINDERNPVGRWLVERNGGDIWLLLAVKAIGTITAATLLLVLFWTVPRLAWIACIAVAAFHVVLLLWLYQF